MGGGELNMMSFGPFPVALIGPASDRAISESGLSVDTLYVCSGVCHTCAVKHIAVSFLVPITP